MDSMWLEVILNTKAEDLDDLCAKLIANGVPGLAVEEEEEFRAFLEENRQYWDYVDEALLDQMKGVSRVKLYVTDDADGQAQLKTYLAGIDLPYHHPPPGVRLGPQLAEVLPPPGHRETALHRARMGAGHRRHP